MKHRLLFAALGAVSSGLVGSGCKQASAQETRAAAAPTEQTREVELLVYSADFGMVQETRQVSLDKGVTRVGLTDVSKALDQNSVLFSWPDRKDALVRSSTYDLGMDDSGSLLKRFLGKEIELVYRNQNGTEGDRVKGTLEVADTGNIVVKSNGKYLVNPDATIEAPTNLGIVTIPQLTAEVESGTAGSTKLGVSYLTGGLSWSADYTLTLPGMSDAGMRDAGKEIHNPKSTIASLDCWASVVNKTGTDFPDAALKFVAGSPNRAMVATEQKAMFGMTEERIGFNRLRSKTYPVTSRGISLDYPDALNVGELHAYPYESKATIRQDQINRVRMMGIEGVSLKKWYAISAPTLWRDGFEGNPDQRLTATLGINFKNDEASKLGKPMPAGAVRVYEPDAKGRPQYIGAASIQDTPRDARVSLTLSNVFDVYAQSKVVKSEKVGKRKVRKTLEIVVHNEKGSSQEVRLVQNFYGPFTIVSESAKGAKLNAMQRQWSLQVPAGGEVKLKVVAEFLMSLLRWGLVSASLALVAIAPCRELPQGLVRTLEKAGVLKGAIYAWESTEDQVIATACRVGSANVMSLIGLGKPIPGGWTIASGTEGEARLRIAKRQLPNLKRLIALSAKVLSKDGVDTRKLSTDMSLAQRALPELISWQSAKWVLDIPETHIWHEHLASLFRLGLVPRQSIPLMRGPWSWSRLEFAIFARTAAQTLPTVARRLVRDKKDVEAVRAVTALVEKFAPELHALGHSPERLLFPH